MQTSPDNQRANGGSKLPGAFTRLHRRSFQFSLRSLLLSIVATALVCGIAVYYWRLPERQAREFFAHIQEGRFSEAEEMFADEAAAQTIYEGVYPWGRWTVEQREMAILELSNHEMKWNRCVFSIHVPEGGHYGFNSTYAGIMPLYVFN